MAHRLRGRFPKAPKPAALDFLRVQQAAQHLEAGATVLDGPGDMVRLSVGGRVVMMTTPRTITEARKVGQGEVG